MKAGSLCSGLPVSQNSLFYLNLFLLLPVLKPLPMFIFVSLPETMALSALFERLLMMVITTAGTPVTLCCLAGVRCSYIALG